MLDKKDKAAIVTQVKEEAGRAYDGALADYAGTNVASMTDLRVQARATQVYLKITRNTLIKRGIEGTHFACMTPELEGPTLLGFSREEPGSVARLFKNFAKEHPNFRVKCLSINGRFLAGDEIDILANLPTRAQALTQLATGLQAAVRKLAVAVHQIPSGLVRALDAVRRASPS